MHEEFSRKDWKSIIIKPRLGKFKTFFILFLDNHQLLKAFQIKSFKKFFLNVQSNLRYISVFLQRQDVGYTEKQKITDRKWSPRKHFGTTYVFP